MHSPSSSIVLVAVALLGHNAVSAAQSQPAPPAADTEWTVEKPLIGRAIPCASGHIKSFECRNVELLSYLPRSLIGGASGGDIWGWIDSTTNREFVAMGGPTGTTFVEVTDPVNPKYLGLLRPHGGLQIRGAQSVKIYKDYAFVGYEGIDHGIQIFDLTQLRDVKSPVEFKETAHYDGLANTHTIAVNQQTGFIYVNGSNTCGGGLHMLDVHTPTKPTFVGCYSEPKTGSAGTGYVHDTQCVVYHGPDQQYKGREICVSYAETGISIADVTDKQHPKTISIATYPNVGYTHQGWFTEDQRYIYLDDEGDEGTVGHTRTIGFDLNDLDDPVVLTEFLNTTTETDHNLYIRGQYMYQGNYGAGFRIIDVADRKNLKEAGYLTTAGDAWGTYPFFKNDVVAVTADAGLFLARLRTQ
jgi:choice-of-anchor B domain-containing protein